MRECVGGPSGLTRVGVGVDEGGVCETKMSPLPAAARATPTSPSAWNILLPAVGAGKKGMSTPRPIIRVPRFSGGLSPARMW